MSINNQNIPDNKTNSSDFQPENQTIKEEPDLNTINNISNEDIKEHSINKQVDIENIQRDATEEVIANNSNENKHCTLDRKKDEKLKNLSFICIPFILAAIVISLFNIGKVRQPLSFLLLAIGLIALAISNFIRSKIISKSCSCKDCLHQSKSSFKYSILYGIASLGFFGFFIYYIAV